MNEPRPAVGRRACLGKGPNMTPRTTRLRALLLATGAAGLLAPSIGGEAATTSAITQADAQSGAQQHPQLLQEFGGAMTGPQAQYVEQVGKNIAVQSGLSNARDAFTVSLLNSSV